MTTTLHLFKKQFFFLQFQVTNRQLVETQQWPVQTLN